MVDDDSLRLRSFRSGKETTGSLPWTGFWARELLCWCTNDSFVAFCSEHDLLGFVVNLMRRYHFRNLGLETRFVTG